MKLRMNYPSLPAIRMNHRNLLSIQTNHPNLLTIRAYRQSAKWNTAMSVVMS